MVSLVCCDYFLLCGFLPVLVLVSFLPLSLYAGRVGEGKGSLSVTASGGQFLRGPIPFVNSWYRRTRGGETFR